MASSQNWWSQGPYKTHSQPRPNCSSCGRYPMSVIHLWVRTVGTPRHTQTWRSKENVMDSIKLWQLLWTLQLAHGKIVQYVQNRNKKEIAKYMKLGTFVRSSSFFNFLRSDPSPLFPIHYLCKMRRYSYRCGACWCLLRHFGPVLEPYMRKKIASDL